MNRINQKFKDLKKKRKKAFIAFVTAGDPNLNTTEKLVLSFEKVGVDIVELGVPFSDPLADGKTIQASSQRALARGVNLSKIFTLVKKIRQHSDIPIALMTYYNPVFHYGVEKFMKNANQVGVDGIIIPDLPPEEGFQIMSSARKNNIATTFFMAPTTAKHRIKRIDQASSGFVYYVSLTGVTGARSQLPQKINTHIKTIKRIAKKPICVGFGISKPSQVKSLSKVADGVIVGSEIINAIERNKGKVNLVANVSRSVQHLTKALN